MTKIRIYPDTAREELADAAVAALRDYPAAIARHGVTLRGTALMQERPRCTRRLRSSFLRYILDGAVAFEGPTRDGGWKRVEPPGVIVRDVAARAREWVPLHRQLPVVPRHTPPAQIARVRLARALPGLRLEIAGYDGAMQLLRVRYGGGREYLSASEYTHSTRTIASPPWYRGRTRPT